MEFAVNIGNLDILQFFLNKKTQPSCVHIEQASGKNDLKMVKMLFDKYKKYRQSPNSVIRINSNIIKTGNVEIVKYLVSNDASLLSSITTTNYNETHLKKFITLAEEHKLTKMVDYLSEQYFKLFPLVSMY